MMTPKQLNAVVVRQADDRDYFMFEPSKEGLEAAYHCLGLFEVIMLINRGCRLNAINLAMKDKAKKKV